ncbi:MAG: YicC/YloC family endoribonuclease, partial [Myxococcota bacterium]
MTGYGRGVADVDGRRAVVELRSVNHRFLDVKLRGSALEPSVEDQVTAQVRSQCERGAVTATIRVEERGALAALRVDMDAARRVHAELAELAGELGCPQPIRLGLVCAQPGVMVPVDSESSAPAVWRCVSAALGPALDQ